MGDKTLVVYSLNQIFILKFPR